MTIPIPLQEALRDSITSGSFVDTKFWLFSKRRSNPRRVGGPQALFVNGHVARRVPRLGALLDECKNGENLRTGFPANRKPYSSSYDYDYDSDLEEDYDEDVSDNVTTEESENDSPELIAIEHSDTKSSGSPDIISDSDLDSLLSESPDAKDDTKPAHVGKVVVIEDVAFITFQALLRYLYTNEIEFAPWGSAERREARALETIESYGIPKPSPKSIYRLADKYNIPELKELALGQIRQDLSKCNIVEEVFSKFTSWYPELRELKIRQLARKLLSLDSDFTLQSLKKEIENYTSGQLPHATHVITALYELMESDEPIEEIPILVAAPTHQQAPSGDWIGLKKALTSSLTSGTFLDSQFYAVESRSSTGLPKIRPMYFCSLVGGDFVSRLMKSSSKLKARKAPVRFTDGHNSDIEDEEPDQEHSTTCYPHSKCIRESPVPAHLLLDPALMLNYGGAKTWSAVFLYVYTGRVTFAPIVSQGVTYKKAQNDHSEDDAKLPQDHEGFGPLLPTVEPCSPKSIYCLANKVGLTGLCDIAFKDIQSKLNERNIIEELFSPFTADHRDIREMEYELFRSKLKPLVDRASISNIIESSSSGERPHHAAAMGLILERSIQERRQRTSEKAKNTPQPDSTSQPEKRTSTPTTPIPPVQPPAPAPAPQPLSQLSSSSTPAPASAKTETSPSSSAPSEPGEETRAGRKKRYRPNTKTNPTLEHTVKMTCSWCNPQKSVVGWYHSILCLNSALPLKCDGCGAANIGSAETCTGCHGWFGR